MAFNQEKPKYCTISLTITEEDKKNLYDELVNSEETFESMADFQRQAVNEKLDRMGVAFRLD